MNSDIEDRLNTMKREIDALQVSVTSASKPWYENIATWVSVAALLFSFGTTYVSFKRADAQDVANARQELRTLLQRLAALPKENVKVLKEYENDPASRSLVSGMVNQENSFVGRSAADLARSLPTGSVSASEYQAIAQALGNSYDLLGAKEFLEYSLNANPDFNTEVSSMRQLANLSFIQGAAQAGRDIYRKALDIFAKYPQYDSFTKTQTNVTTELAWAVSEANSGFYGEAINHVEAADRYVSPLANTESADLLRSSVAQLRQRITAAAKGSTSVTGMSQLPTGGLGLPTGPLKP